VRRSRAWPQVACSQHSSRCTSQACWCCTAMSAIALSSGGRHACSLQEVTATVACSCSGGVAAAESAPKPSVPSHWTSPSTNGAATSCTGSRSQSYMHANAGVCASCARRDIEWPGGGRGCDIPLGTCTPHACMHAVGRLRVARVRTIQNWYRIESLQGCAHAARRGSQARFGGGFVSRARMARRGWRGR